MRPTDVRRDQEETLGCAGEDVLNFPARSVVVYCYRPNSLKGIVSHEVMQLGIEVVTVISG